MKAFKVNNLITPYKAHAFIEAQGNEDLIKEHVTYDINSTQWMVEDGILSFTWDVNDEEVEHQYEMEVETSTELEISVDYFDGDTQDVASYIAVFSCIKIGELTYYSIDHLKSDLGKEIGSKIKDYIDSQVENANDEL
jgi:hypothetical protein